MFSQFRDSEEYNKPEPDKYELLLAKYNELKTEIEKLKAELNNLRYGPSAEDE